MNKAELISSVAKKLNTSFKYAEENVNILLETISEELIKGESIKFVNFGLFAVAQRAPRKGYNPHNGEEIIIPACKEPVFKPGKALKELINK